MSEVYMDSETLSGITAIASTCVRRQSGTLGRTVDESEKFNLVPFNRRQGIPRAFMLSAATADGRIVTFGACLLKTIGTLTPSRLRVRFRVVALASDSGIQTIKVRKRLSVSTLGGQAGTAAAGILIGSYRALLESTGAIDVHSGNILVGASASRSIASLTILKRRVRVRSAAISSLGGLSAVKTRKRLSSSTLSTVCNTIVAKKRLRTAAVTASAVISNTQPLRRVRTSKSTLSGVCTIPTTVTRERWKRRTISGDTTMKVAYYTTQHVTLAMYALSSLEVSAARSPREAFNDDVRQVVPRVVVYFEDGVATTFDMDNITSFELLEELKADTALPFGAVSSNMLTFSIDNTNGIFNPTNSSSPYYGKMKPNLVVEPYIGIYVTKDILTYVPLGTFKTTNWAPTENLDVTVTCYDELYFLANENVPTLGVQHNISIKDFTLLVLSELSVTSDRVIFDGNFDTVLDAAWLPSGGAVTGLQLIAVASHSFLFIDRQNRYVFKQVDLTKEATAIINDDNQIINASIPLNYDGTYSQMTVNCCTPTLTEGEIVTSLSDLDIEHGTNTIELSKFSKGPVATLEEGTITGTDCYITGISYGAWDYALEVYNGGSATHEDVTLIGTVINSSITPYTVEDADYAKIIGKREITINNHLIQSAAVAQSYLTNFFPFLKNPTGKVVMSVRGNPAIQLGEVLSVSDNAEHLDDEHVMVYRSVLQFDSGLSGTLEGYRLP